MVTSIYILIVMLLISTGVGLTGTASQQIQLANHGTAQTTQVIPYRRRSFDNAETLAQDPRSTFAPAVLPGRSENSFSGQTAQTSIAPEPNWDEQIGLTFTQSFVSLAYNVTAVAQTGQDGYGPAYLLNGLTNTGYWYQVGLSYNWPYTTGGYNAGFALNYEVFDPNKNVVDPATGYGGLKSFDGIVKAGDKVLLSLYISGNSIVMSARDWNTDATASETYSSESSSYFEGLTSGTADSNGYFTGIMTEEYHTQQYYGAEEQVIYTETGYIQKSAWMWIDEWNTNTSQVLFSDSTPSPVSFSNPQLLIKFESNGAIEYADATEFVTGQSQLVLSATMSPVYADASTPVTINLVVAINGGTAPYNMMLFLDNAFAGNYTTPNGTLNIVSNLGTLSGGNHVITLEGFDSQKLVANSISFDFVVNPDPTISIGTRYLTIDLGQSINISVLTSGGTPPYKEVLYLNRVPEGEVSSVVPSQLGDNLVVVNLTDAAGFSLLSNELAVQVRPDPAVIINSSSISTDAGVPIQIEETAFNGTPPYSVLWLVNGTLLQGFSNMQAFNFTQSTPGIYSIVAEITDSVGYTVQSVPNVLRVNPSPRISGFKTEPYSSSFLFVNNRVYTQVSVSGGTPPFTYVWMLNGAPLVNSSIPELQYNLSGMGVNRLSVSVVDHAGVSVTSQQIEVNYGYDVVHLTFIAVIVVVGIGISFLMIKRRSQSRRLSDKPTPGNSFL